MLFLEFLVILCSCKQEFRIATSCASESSLSITGDIWFIRRLFQHCSAIVVTRCMGIGMIGQILYIFILLTTLIVKLNVMFTRFVVSRADIFKRAFNYKTLL